MRQPLSRKHWYYVALIALAGGIWFAAPFMGVIALAGLMAFLFYGLYTRLLKRLKAPLSAFLTFVISIIVILVPLIIVMIFTVAQLTQLASDLYVAADGAVGQAVNQLIAWLNGTFGPVVGAEIVSGDGAREFIQSTLPAILQGIVGFITSLIGSMPLALALTILYIVLFYEFLIYGKTLLKNIVKLSPFDEEVSRLYLSRVGVMADAMAKGQFYIAFIIAALSALILAACFHMWDYFFLMTVTFTLLNLVPMGSGIVIFPVIFIAMLSGLWIPGLIALILFILVSNLDAYIRPKMIPRGITLSPGLTMLAAYGGIAIFGLIGVVYGPILTIIIVTSLQMYLDADMPQKARRLRETLKKPFHSSK